MPCDPGALVTWQQQSVLHGPCAKTLCVIALGISLSCLSIGLVPDMNVRPCRLGILTQASAQFTM